MMMRLTGPLDEGRRGEQCAKEQRKFRPGPLIITGEAVLLCRGVIWCVCDCTVVCNSV